MEAIETTLNHKIKGFIKIWAVSPKDGSRILLIDKPNLILNEGADLLAASLAGVQNAHISNIYIGYNTIVGEFINPLVDKEYSVKFSNYGVSEAYSTFGYLRLPLAYSPSFMTNAEGYVGNIALFTAVISSVDRSNGAEFNSAADANPAHPASQIFEVALVGALDSTGPAQDKVFSRAQFTPLLYDPNFNLTITWGVQFLA